VPAEARIAAADLARLIGPAARALLGEPNRALSRRGELRFGSRGALSVDCAAGRFYDHERGTGGGTLDLIAHVRGGTRAEAARWLAELAGGHARAVVPVARPAVPLRNGHAERAERVRRALALWAEAGPWRRSPVERYLSARLGAAPAGPVADVRFHPRCPFGPHGQREAMIALIRHVETGRPQGVHRTALRRGGGRDRSIPKMMLGQAAGGAVWLCDDGEIETGLIIGEGIESTLAAAARWRWPALAALSAGGLARFPILAGIERLVIAADADDAGIAAARTLARRYAEAGRFAEVIRPATAGRDFADLAVARP
jgi:hypothetical protein